MLSDGSLSKVNERTTAYIRLLVFSLRIVDLDSDSKFAKGLSSFLSCKDFVRDASCDSAFTTETFSVSFCSDLL